MKKKLFAILALMAVVSMLAAQCAGPATPAAQPAAQEAPKEVKLILWNQETESEDVMKAIRDWAQEYTSMHPEVTFEVVDKQTETLREDFQTASLAGNPPDLLWTVNDHAGPFVTADIIQPVDDLFDLSVFVDSALAAVDLNNKHWGVPISNGNHLMLLYNKKLVSEPPKDTDELFKMGQELTSGDTYGLVWNQKEPFWLVPWLGGFKGKVFADDGVTPTLNTPEMVATLQFLYDMKYEAKIIPPETDYDAADALFKEGKAAMIINGDWSLGGYAELEDLDFGVARIPMVTATGEWPKPYTSGKYFMLPKDLSGDKLEAAKGFINWVTSKDIQLRQLDFKRLPALNEALGDPKVAEDPILKGSAEQMAVGVPMPTVIEMRCNWDAMKPEMQAVLSDTETPEDAAPAMQTAADNCIKTLE
jgi:arabinogalactan oligomer/maltooligosaccharide transport system substrate-binding protein